MKLNLLTTILLLVYCISHGQPLTQAAHQTNVSLEKQTINFNLKEKKSFFEQDAVKIALVPTIFFGASATVWNSRKDVKEVRNRYIPTFKYKFDDYMQYTPAAITFGLKAAGVKGRNNIKRTTISYAASMAVMAVLVNGLKYTTKVERPDGTSKNSFPSGHTAMAFANATFMDKEYGLVNPAYSIGGYGLATLTGVGRSLNNRHWTSDVLAGAGIGILSTQLAYFFVDKIYGNKGDNLSILSKYEGNTNPSFLSIKLGVTSGLESLVETEESESLNKLGWEAGLEGAYFFTKNWGLGGQIMVASFPFSENKITPQETPGLEAKVLSESMGYMTASIGPYYAIHFSERWNLMLKALGGYSIGADGTVTLKALSGESYIPELVDGKVQIASYTPENVFQFTGGMALTYNLTDNLGATIYSDFNHSMSKITYELNDSSIDQGQIPTNTVKGPFNYLSAGVRLTAYF